MTLQQWVTNGWLRPHQSSLQEISGLFSIVQRDLDDAEGNISADWQFGIAYNAALKLCTILLHASGYDRDHTIGHSYLMGITTLEGLERTFRQKILPLLQEYFYGDWHKIQLVLGDLICVRQGVRLSVRDAALSPAR